MDWVIENFALCLLKYVPETKRKYRSTAWGRLPRIDICL